MCELTPTCEPRRCLNTLFDVIKIQLKLRPSQVRIACIIYTAPSARLPFQIPHNEMIVDVKQ